MKILAYRISQKGPRALPALIDHLHGVELNARAGIGGLRLEERAMLSRMLVMDFAKPRGGHGPGRMSPTDPLEAIRLRQGQDFGEDTGIAFDLQSGCAAIQYNHFGPRPRAIEEYLWGVDLSLGGRPELRRGESDADRYGFTFGAVLTRDAYERLRTFAIVHDVSVTVALPGVTPQDFAAGRALGDILRAPLPDGTETLKISISAGARGSLARHGAMRMVDDIRRLGHAAQAAVVRGKPTDDDPYEKVDLIEERLSVSADIPLGPGRRYSRDDRWHALAQALVTWRDSGELVGTDE